MLCNKLPNFSNLKITTRDLLPAWKWDISIDQFPRKLVKIISKILELLEVFGDGPKGILQMKKYLINKIC